MAVAGLRPDLLDRLANGLLLTGPAAGLRGLGQMLERRLMQRFSYGGRQQVGSSWRGTLQPLLFMGAQQLQGCLKMGGRIEVLGFNSALWSSWQFT